MPSELYTLRDVVIQAGSPGDAIVRLFELQKKLTLNNQVAVHLVLTNYIATCLELQRDNQPYECFATYPIQRGLMTALFPELKQPLPTVPIESPYDLTNSIAEFEAAIKLARADTPALPASTTYETYKHSFSGDWTLRVSDLTGEFECILSLVTSAFSKLQRSRFGMLTPNSRISEIGIIQDSIESTIGLYCTIEDDAQDRVKLRFLKERTFFLTLKPQRKQPILFEVSCEDNLVRLEKINELLFFEAMHKLQELFRLGLLDSERKWQSTGKLITA